MLNEKVGPVVGGLLLGATVFSLELVVGFFGLALATATEAVLDTSKLNSSRRCGVCHAQIYAMWSHSLHSGAVTDPIFKAAYALAYKNTAGAARELCLRCHAPVAFLTADLELKEDISKEGVTCDFCHSITGVDLEKRDHPYRLRLDGVKRGPFGDAQSPAHRVEESKLHRQSEICAGCHEYANRDGLLIFSTYSEWRLSPQAREGKTCQHCHMPVTPGDTVAPGRGSGRRLVNLHNISGGHSTEQVRKAASLAILTVRRRQPTLAQVEVEVSNVGSGHYIPTGLPSRKLVLEVDLYAGLRKVRTFERIYQRVLLDAQHRPIQEDYRILVEAKQLRSDNRLRAGEKRVERFVSDVPPEGRLRAVARLRYLYEPLLLRPTQMSILMASDETF